MASALDWLAARSLGLAARPFLNRDVAVVERRGERMGNLLYRIDRKHRERALSNLEMAFPEWSPEQRVATARGVFGHFGLVGADFFRTPARPPEEIPGTTETEGLEYLEEAVAAGKGVILSSGHLGNWHRLWHWLTSTGRSLNIVAREAKQGGIEDQMQGVRNATGLTVHRRGSAMHPLQDALRRGEVVGLLPDQNSKHCYVPFFGKPAGTVVGPGLLHQRTGAALLPAFFVRTGPGRYLMSIRPPLDPENRETDVEALAALVNAQIESAVRQWPEQWLWMHDRWKSARKKGLL